MCRSSEIQCGWLTTCRYRGLLQRVRRGTSEEAAAALQASNEGGDRDLKCRVLDVA